MTKKVKYNLGDVFKIPLINGYYGLGRILIIQSPAIFVGFYGKIISVVSNEEIEIYTFKEKKYFLKIMCGDLGFKRNEWFIIGNIPIEERIHVPYFWGKNNLTEELYLRKYNTTEKDPLGLGTGFIDKPTTFEEINEKDAQPDGLFGWKGAEIKLKIELEKAGIL